MSIIHSASIRPLVSTEVFLQPILFSGRGVSPRRVTKNKSAFIAHNNYPYRYILCGLGSQQKYSCVQYTSCEMSVGRSHRSSCRCVPRSRSIHERVNEETIHTARSTKASAQVSVATKMLFETSAGHTTARSCAYIPISLRTQMKPIYSWSLLTSKLQTAVVSNGCKIHPPTECKTLKNT